jgi:hypothetical protein
VPGLYIPPSYRKGLIDLLSPESLDRSSFDTFVSELKNHPEANIFKPIRLSGVQIDGLERKAADDILDVVALLFRVWALAADRTMEAFVDDVSEAIATFDSIGQSPESKQRLRTILNIEPIASLSKARAVLTDNQYDFYDAKILTDIRYAFRPNPEDEPYGAVIVHLLKLSYHEEGDHKSLYLALDDTDLERIRDVINRAETKAKRLRKHLDIAQVRYFGGKSQ